jgi:hypothetical protein
MLRTRNLCRQRLTWLREAAPAPPAPRHAPLRRAAHRRHGAARGQDRRDATGEGKTLVATLPAYLNALPGKGVHVVTVNDYLARRDAEWMGRIYRFLGLSVGVIVHDAWSRDRAQGRAYAADITYGTNNEFGFDYLRDNMKFSRSKVQRPLNFAIVDEVDSILIDEARTPLIISGPASSPTLLQDRRSSPQLSAAGDATRRVRSPTSRAITPSTRRPGRPSPRRGTGREAAQPSRACSSRGWQPLRPGNIR